MMAYQQFPDFWFINDTEVAPKERTIKETSSAIMTDEKFEKTTMLSHVSTEKREPKELIYPQREQKASSQFTINVLRTVWHEDQRATHKATKEPNDSR